ncbi:MAG: V-type ATP synthase subunit E family protein [Clostridia bacterium]|nr:V-type ATP synthase subunit E family protein [Clostridia bacterium]
MAGLENILNKISADSAAKVENIIFQAETEASEILAKAKEEAEKQSKLSLENAEKEADNIIARAESSAKLDSQNTKLETENEIIEDSINSALSQLNDLPDSEYFDVIKKLVKKYASNKQGVAFFSKRDLDRLPANFESDLNSLLSDEAKLVISNEPIAIKNGVVLEYGEVDINCTFDALASDIKDQLKDKIYKILFA